MTGRLARLLLLLFVIWTTLSVLPPAPAFACSCEIPPTALDGLAKADLVFTGRVKQIGKSVQQDGTYDKVVLEVHESWKGTDRAEATVLTSWSSCQFSFERGADYLLYAYEWKGGYHVQNCGRSALLAHAMDDVNQLGPGLRPQAASAAGSGAAAKYGWLAVVLGGVLPGLAAVRLIRKGRRG